MTKTGRAYRVTPHAKPGSVRIVGADRIRVLEPLLPSVKSLRIWYDADSQMIDGMADGRAHAGPLGKTLLHIAAGGWIKLNRLADSLREVTRTSILAERVISEILDQLIASWETLPRDGNHVLALQLELLSKLGQAPTPRTREVLTTIPVSGKSAKLAKQLCCLSSDITSLSRRQAAIEAAQGRLTHAERITRFAERHRVNA